MSLNNKNENNSTNETVNITLNETNNTTDNTTSEKVSTSTSKSSRSSSSTSKKSSNSKHLVEGTDYVSAEMSYSAYEHTVKNNPRGHYDLEEIIMDLEKDNKKKHVIQYP